MVPILCLYPQANPVEYDITWVTDSNREWTFSIVPGWLYGRRFQLDKAYFSLGGGLVVNSNSVGPGAYFALGYDYCSFLCFNFEYKAAMGMGVT